MSAPRTREEHAALAGELLEMGRQGLTAAAAAHQAGDHEARDEAWRQVELFTQIAQVHATLSGPVSALVVAGSTRDGLRL